MCFDSMWAECPDLVEASYEAEDRSGAVWEEYKKNTEYGLECMCVTVTDRCAPFRATEDGNYQNEMCEQAMSCCDWAKELGEQCDEKIFAEQQDLSDLASLSSIPAIFAIFVYL